MYFIKKIVSLALTLLMMVCLFAGCKNETILEGHMLDYGTECSLNGINTDRYYQNSEYIVSGADPGVIYISQEEDPVYGGYFYMYTSAQLDFPGGEYGEKVVLANECFRSTDLVSWERCGACDGYALISQPDDWTLMNFWAPEVYRHPEDGKYYMYYSAQRGYVDRYSDAFTADYDRLYLAIAVSDSPMGPFTLVRSGIDANGDEITNVPIFDFASYFNLDTCFSAIDASLFRDTDGSLYVTFAKHEDSSGYERGIWGIKMLDPVTPDFSTITCLTIHSQKSVVDYPSGSIVQPVSGGFFRDEVLNEGNFIIQKDGKYYLTYSPFGYGDRAYCVMQAVSDNPLGPYVKLDWGKGNPVVSAVATGMNYMAGTGHHSIVTVGNELFTVYHHHGNPQTYSDGNPRRVIGIDRLEFTEIDGQSVLVCNGPTATPQYQAAAISGYENIAAQAKISVTGGTGAEYLNDGLLSVTATLMEYEFVSDGAVTITMEFPEAVAVSSVMIYNSNNYEQAFSSIDEIRFYYAQPREVDGKYYSVGLIQDLPFPEESVNTEQSWIYQGAAAIADFNEISVTKIEITLSQKYISQNVDGSAMPQIGISDIVVLNKTAQ